MGCQCQPPSGHLMMYPFPEIHILSKIPTILIVQTWWPLQEPGLQRPWLRLRALGGPRPPWCLWKQQPCTHSLPASSAPGGLAAPRRGPCAESVQRCHHHGLRPQHGFFRVVSFLSSSYRRQKRNKPKEAVLWAKTVVVATLHTLCARAPLLILGCSASHRQDLTSYDVFFPRL